MPDWFAAPHGVRGLKFLQLSGPHCIPQGRTPCGVRGLKFKAVIAEGIIETIKKGR